MSDDKDKEAALVEIAFALNGIDVEDMTATENEICDVLVRIGVMEKLKQELDGEPYWEYWIKSSTE